MFGLASSPEHVNLQNPIHLEKLPIKFISNVRNQNFQMRLRKLNNDHKYEKIELNFENDKIYIKNMNDSFIYSTDFPSPLILRKSLLSPENFDWETTKTQIIISYKHPPQTIIIDDEEDLGVYKVKPPIIPTLFIDDSKEEQPKKTIQIIDNQNIEEFEKVHQYTDAETQRFFKKKLKLLMENIQKEFSNSLPLKQTQVKALAKLLLEKGYDSYEKASEDGYSFNVFTLKLEKDGGPKAVAIDSSEFRMMEEQNALDQACEDFKEAEKKNKKKPNNDEIYKKRLFEKRAKDIMQSMGNTAIFGEENEFSDYEIKKKGSLYVINENKFKAMLNQNKREKIQKKREINMKENNISKNNKFASNFDDEFCIIEDKDDFKAIGKKNNIKRNRKLVFDNDDEGEMFL